MSFAKRCGVAIATRWTLVIFAACKEAMALGVGSWPSQYSLKNSHGTQKKGALVQMIFLFKQVIVRFHANLFFGGVFFVASLGESMSHETHCHSKGSILSKSLHPGKNLEKLPNGNPEWWTCKRYFFSNTPTLSETNIAPKEWLVGILLSYSEGLFSERTC